MGDADATTPDNRTPSGACPLPAGGYSYALLWQPRKGRYPDGAPRQPPPRPAFALLPRPHPGAGAVMAISGGQPCPGGALTAVSRSDTGFPGGGGAGVLPFPAEGCPYLFTPGVIAACPAYRRVDLIPAGYLLSPKPRDVLPEILRRPRGPAAPSRIIPNPENSINTGSTSIPPLTGPDNP
jgi:hypothetical protein